MSEIARKREEEILRQHREYRRTLEDLERRWRHGRPRGDPERGVRVDRDGNVIIDSSCRRV